MAPAAERQSKTGGDAVGPTSSSSRSLMTTQTSDEAIAQQARIGRRVTAKAPPPPPPGPKETEEAPIPVGFHWRRLVAKAQERRKWSVRGQALNYAKHGMPQHLDGPARGFGKHLGRWGWRDIVSSW